jgi:hypothetical protein
LIAFVAKRDLIREGIDINPVSQDRVRFTPEFSEPIFRSLNGFFSAERKY